jgi:hypothetical protein
VGDEYHIENLHNVQGLQMGRGGSQKNYFHAAPRAEQRQLVEELVRQTRAHASELAEPEELALAAAELDSELDRDEPRAGKLQSLLDRLARAAGGVTAVAEAVSDVRRAIGLDGS